MARTPVQWLMSGLLPRRPFGNPLSESPGRILTNIRWDVSCPNIWQTSPGTKVRKCDRRKSQIEMCGWPGQIVEVPKIPGTALCSKINKQIAQSRGRAASVKNQLDANWIDHSHKMPIRGFFPSRSGRCKTARQILNSKLYLLSTVWRIN